ncbi:DUF3077 domain-containing protein [Pseudomonas syringae]|nr:DUF3077 domain-containing protein [Pseudomonas syringae]MBD8790830.1 DUF3077 domain-containing protein [Pseudomonas syringae]MBD8802035.1 DUF3077 domain-containing protein [Pseudomonas syringae]MBD8814601.1 DUF3077 domain-containing protein [Pseudomonas syringae]
MKKIVPDPPVPPRRPLPPSLLTYEAPLTHASELLQCAYATAYECADSLQGQRRALALSTTHLITQAQDLIDLIIDHLQIDNTPPQPTPE